MKTVKKVIADHPVVVYFVLTFILTWGCMAIVVYPSGFPITEEQLATSGPLVYLAMLVGPSVAGLLMTALADGRAGFRALLSRLLTWRVGARWYAVALLTAPVVIATVLFGLSLVSPAYQPAIVTADDKTAVIISAVMAGLVVGFFEELGWTGFAVPRLRRRCSVLATGLIVGVVWGAWHFLPFWKSDTFSAAVALALLLGQLFSWLPAYRILMSWVYDRTHSLLVCSLMHASLVASLSIFVPAELYPTALLVWILSWAAALWVIVAVLALSTRGRLSQRPLQRRMA